MKPSPSGLALAVLAAASFMFVTTETQPVALLSPMAQGLHVSESTVGLLMTVYAAVAALTAIPLTLFASRVPRRRLVMATVLILVISQAAFAVAPSYPVVVIARLLGALAHGVFWSVIAQVAATLVSRDRVGKATAAVFAGNSMALVVGTPLETALGALLGWRVAVGVTGVLAALTVLGMSRVLPAIGSPEAHLGRREVLSGAFGRPRLLIVCAVTLLMALGQFAAFTYLAPIVRSHSGLTGAGLALVLLAYGLAGVLGVVAVGAFSDRHPRTALLTCCTAVVAALTTLSAESHSIPVLVIATVAWGAGFTALPICLQSAVLRVAAPIPDTASALYVVAFQIGIGAGALVGAGLLHGGDLSAIPPVALGLFAGGSLIAAAAGSTFTRDPESQPFRRPRRRSRGEHRAHEPHAGQPAAHRDRTVARRG